MELKEFIKTAISDIVTAVSEISSSDFKALYATLASRDKDLLTAVTNAVESQESGQIRDVSLSDGTRRCLRKGTKLSINPLQFPEV